MVQKDKRYLVTGASGFLGQALIKKLISMGCKINALSRNEGKLIELKNERHVIDIFPGDVADDWIVKRAAQGCSGIFHLAAFKHVTMAEQNAIQCISSNIQGSFNVCDTAMKYNSIKFVIGISTDKAAQISGVYGATKRLMEKTFQEFEISDKYTAYRIVRYGNVLYSTGSVLCKWKKLLQDGKDITVTNPESTRFYWTREQAIDLIFQCLDKGISAAPYVPEMKGIRLGNLAKGMVAKYGKSNYNAVKINKLESSENLHEKILEDGKYSNEVEQYTIDEITEMI